MLTGNYYNQLYTYLTGKAITGGVKDIQGNTYDTYFYGKGQFSSKTWANFILTCDLATWTYGSSSFVVGSGTTPATLDDYKLESIIETIKNIEPTDALDEEGNYLKIFTVKNVGNNPITVTECGITTSAYRNSYGETVNILVERTVLDNPVTVPAGGTCMITYKVALPNP